MNFPVWLYHKTKPAFQCPNEEYYNSMPDASEYELLPFTGERALAKVKTCPDCLSLEAENQMLRETIKALELTLVNVKTENYDLMEITKIYKNENILYEKRYRNSVLREKCRKVVDELILEGDMSRVGREKKVEELCLSKQQKKSCPILRHKISERIRIAIVVRKRKMAKQKEKEAHRLEMIKTESESVAS